MCQKILESAASRCPQPNHAFERCLEANVRAPRDFMSPQLFPEDRLDAWFDGSAICLIAVGSHGDPIDLGEEEAQARGHNDDIEFLSVP